jgi:hypothetical protein
MENKMEDAAKVFELGTLCIFETHNWQATKKISGDAFKELFKDEEDLDWIKSTKQLIDKTELKDLNSLISKFRTEIDSVALPFPIEAFRFIAKDEVEALSKCLTEIKREIEVKAEKLDEKFDSLIAFAKKKLDKKGLFNRKDYPKNIKERFGVKFRFLEMRVPGEMQKFSPNVYKEEMEKYRQLMKQTRDEAVIFLREAFLEIVEHITGVLTGDDGQQVIRQDQLDKLDVFFHEFQTKNVFKDTELNNIIKEAKDTMFGINAKDLRTSEALRKAIAKNMEKVENSIEKSITKFKRSISLD